MCTLRDMFLFGQRRKNEQASTVHTRRLADVVKMPIELAKCQRELDQDRVDEIVTYHRNLLVEQGEICFINCITLCRACDKLYLVDGQHRYEAMKRLEQLAPDCNVHIEEIDLSRTSLTIYQVFALINKAVPVPEYVIETMSDQVRRDVMDVVKSHMRGLYKAYDSKATNPRRPNLKLDTLVKVVCDNTILPKLNTDPQRIVDMVKWVNAQLSTLVDVPPKKASNAEVCYIGMCPDWQESFTSWALNHYCCNPKIPIPSIRLYPKRPSSKRKIPAAIKKAVWLSIFPGKLKGECLLCRGELDAMDFEAGHIVPESKMGGDIAVKNLVPMCGKCNKSVGSRHLEEYCCTHKIDPLVPFDELAVR